MRFIESQKPRETNFIATTGEHLSTPCVPHNCGKSVGTHAGESLVSVCGLSIYLFVPTLFLLCSYSVPTTVCLQVHEISSLFLTFLLFLVKNMGPGVSLGFF